MKIRIVDYYDASQDKLKTLEIEVDYAKAVVTKVTNLDYFLAMFSNMRSPNYRRPYDILADLDKKIIEIIDGANASGIADLPTSWLIPYYDDGYAIFDFSNMEVDKREPDARYRTLYICYEFISTAS